MEGILDDLHHRGPDFRDTLRIPDLQGVLGHTRLSIIDLDLRSNQPFTSPDGRYALVYNGEIYNYRDLRGILVRENVELRTQSDTEVLLTWLVRNGISGLKDLDGMYAFAFLDRKAKSLKLVRDRIGEKPLYFAETSNPKGFAFCSEMRGLTGLPGVDTSFDSEAMKDYLRFLYTPSPRTLYSGIRELEPGSVMTVDLKNGTRTVRKYYDLEAAIECRTNHSVPDPYAVFRQTFDECLDRRLEADVPISAYFSGGVDSSLLVGSVRERREGGGVDTFTVRYRGSRQSEAADESQPARRLADQWRVPNHTIDFSPDFPFRETVDRIVDLFGHPFGNSTAIVSDILAEKVSARYKVALAGDGGDELSGGYPRYRALLVKKYVDWMSPVPEVMGRLSLMMAPLWPRLLTLGRRMTALGDGIGRPPERAFLRWSTYLGPEEVKQATGSEVAATEFQADLLDLFRRNSDDVLRAASLVDLHSFVPYNLLRSADRTGMAHSLEVRVPFLAPDLVEAALSLDHGTRFGWRDSKRLFKRSLGNRIPAWVWNRRKMPFNPPVHDYLRRHFDDLDEYLVGNDARLHEVIHESFVRRQLSDFKSGKRENSTFLWGLATLEAWLRRN